MLVLELKTLAIGEPLIWMVDSLLGSVDVTKLVPVTTRVNGALPTWTVDGEVELIDGWLVEIVKGHELDTPPPGPLLKTVTEMMSGETRSVVVIMAATTALLKKNVCRGEPFQSTVDVPEINPLPAMNKGVGPLPAVAVVGKVAVITGTGLMAVTVAVNDPPPGAGLMTVTT